MKKTYFLLIFFLMSSFLFAQVRKNDNATFKAVKVAKEINSIKNGTKAWTDSIHYDGDNDDAIGTGSASEFGVYMIIPQDSLAAHPGKYLKDVKLYINGATDVTSVEIRLYTDINTEPVYTKPFTAIEGWNTVSIAPYALPATGQLVVGYYLIATGGYPAGCDAGPAEPNGNGDLLFFNGSLQHLTTLGIDCNWNIRAMIGDLSATPVANVDPEIWNAGNVLLGETKTATFTLANAGQGTITCSGISGISAPFTTTFDPSSVNLGTGASTTFDITFTPTNEDAVAQTVTISTSAGDVTISLAGKGYSCSPISTFPWTDDFEAGLNSCYTLLDVDGDGYNWTYNNSGNLAANSGAGVVFSASYDNSVGALTPDNWLIMPAFDFSNASLDYSLKYYVIGQDESYSEEHYGVYVSTTNTDPASFTMIFEETLPAGTTTFLERSNSLDAYKGNSTVYIGFRHFNITDMFQMNIDDITVDGKTGVAENEKSFGIYPNPANDFVKVYTSELSNITITDLRGSVVYAGQVNNNDIISTENFESGLYIVTIETKNNVNRTKLMIN